MDKVEKHIPDVVAIGSLIMFCATPSNVTAAGLAVAAALWAFCAYICKPIPEPPRTDEARFTLLEHELAETKKQLDSVKTAVNMRQLR